MRPGKRPQSEVDREVDVKLARCKRAPPDSPDLYSLPAFPSDAQAQSQRLSTPHSQLLDELGSTPFETMGPDAPFTQQERLDIETFVYHPARSKRGMLSVGDCVERGLRKVSVAQEGPAAALEYFDRLKDQILRASKSPERAEAVHAAMLNSWQQRITGWLGGSVGSAECLADVIDQLITSVKVNVGLAFNAQLQQKLRRTVLDALITSESAQVDTSPTAVIPGAQADDGPEDAGAPSHVQADGESEIMEDAVAKPIPERTALERCPDVRSFFAHHTRRVKRKHLGEAWKDKAVKRAAVAEIGDEWKSLPRSMQVVWEEMHESLLTNGDEYLLRPSAAAKLFTDGRPRTSQQPEADEDEDEDGDEDEPDAIELSDPVAPPSSQSNQPEVRVPPNAPFKSEKVPYRVVSNPENKIYLRVSLKAEPRMVANACRVAVGGLQPETATDAAWHLGHSIFVVSFRNVRMARSLAYSPVPVRAPNPTNKNPGAVRTARPTAWSYPPTAPVIFVARIDCSGVKATSPDMIFHGVARCFPFDAFHVRKETALTVSRLSWLVIFKRPLGYLRFSVPMLQGTAGWKQVSFEPVAPDSACPVCTIGHPALKCDLLVPMSAGDLGIADDHAQYLKDPPKVE